MASILISFLQFTSSCIWNLIDYLLLNIKSQNVSDYLICDRSHKTKNLKKYNLKDRRYITHTHIKELSSLRPETIFRMQTHTNNTKRLDFYVISNK